MSNPRKLFGPAIGGSMLSTGGDPIPGILTKKINDMAPSNDLVKFAAPGAAIQRRVDYGEARTFRLVGDPWGAFNKTQEQKDTIAANEAAEAKAAEDAAAWAAGAPERAANAAGEAANIAMRAKNLRRRASALLATGAGDGGGALLSSVLAYGKGSLGG